MHTFDVEFVERLVVIGQTPFASVIHRLGACDRTLPSKISSPRPPRRVQHTSHRHPRRCRRRIHRRCPSQRLLSILSHIQLFSSCIASAIRRSSARMSLAALERQIRPIYGR